jgi:hypothetical protein
MKAKQSHHTETRTRLDETHRDYKLLTRIEGAILNRAKGKEAFAIGVPKLLRQAIDEVIDSPRSRRFLMNELEKTEKTYLGTKIEILLRDYLQLERGGKGKMDVLIDGVEVDIKNTTGANWMIPTETVGHPCILIRTDETKAKCWFGLVVIRDEVLGEGRNRDGKGSISAAGRQHIHWMLYDQDYPPNFWESVPVSERERLLSPRGGTERLIGLFKQYLGVPFSRQTLISLAPQSDVMKRLRKNGGARDSLEKQGIALLSGDYHSSLIAALGLPPCRSGEFIAVKPSTEADIALLRTEGKLP